MLAGSAASSTSTPLAAMLSCVRRMRSRYSPVSNGSVGMSPLGVLARCAPIERGIGFLANRRAARAPYPLIPTGQGGIAEATKTNEACTAPSPHLETVDPRGGHHARLHHGWIQQSEAFRQVLRRRARAARPGAGRGQRPVHRL